MILTKPAVCLAILTIIFTACFAYAETATGASSDGDVKAGWYFDHFDIEKEPGAGGTLSIGSLDPADGYKFAVEIYPKSSALYTIKLSEHFMTVADKRFVQKNEGDYAAYEAVRKQNPDKYRGHYSLLNPVRKDGRLYLPLATHSIKITDNQTRESVTVRPDDPLKQKQAKDSKEKSVWHVSAVKEDSISLSATLYFGTAYSLKGQDYRTGKKNERALRITKTYTVRKDSYSIDVGLKIENLSSRALTVTVDQYGPTGLPREELRNDRRMASYAVIKNGQKIEVFKVDKGKLDKMALGKHEDVGSTDAAAPALWIAHSNKFFTSVLYPIPATKNTLAAKKLKARFYVAAAEEIGTSRNAITGVVIPGIALAGGAAREIKFDLFAGPKQRRHLISDEAPAHDPGMYKRLDYVNTIDFGGCSFCTFSWLSFAMMWLLQFFSTIGNNYGIAIIILVVLVRLALHPLTKRGQVAMMKMQKLGPQMQKLKEKYGNDKESLNREMMKFYKTKGAGPFLGCLPMFLQMPIWIALWTALNATVELRHAAFLPVWITDLAAPDALFTWTQTLPLIGNTFNLLPILLTIAMFLQTKFNPQMAQSAATSPDQAKQQQMMKIMMPLMMLFIFYSAPSGLTLYIMASTFASVIEQFVIRKHIREREELEAATETTVAIPGKASRDKRPKKPKGPTRYKQG